MNRKQCLQQLDTNQIRITEPRIAMIKAQLEALMQVIEFEKDGEVVNVDGFRLRKTEDWLVPIENNPNVILYELACPCDLSCDFCYLKGLPPTEHYGSMRSFHEVATKVKYFDPQGGKMLFRTLNHVEEVLRYPRIFEVLEMLRKKSDVHFSLVTNGSSLTESFIQRLSEFMPFELSISLNSADVPTCSRLMRDKKAQTAIESLPILQQYGIPFNIGVVPWPTISLDDIAETIRYADQYDVTYIRVGLPGHTKYFPMRPELQYERDIYWREIVEFITALESEISAPMNITPYLFAENMLHKDRKNEAFITGVERNSPAYLAGFRPHDQIVEVNGTPVISRPHAVDLIRQTPQDAIIRTVIRRAGKFYRILIDPGTHGKRASYPYLWFTPQRGLHIPQGFRLGYLDEIKVLIKQHNAQKILLLTTELMSPTLSYVMQEVKILPEDIDLHIEIPKQNYWGGNIVIGDLLVVDDYVDHIKDFISRQGFKPDLVIIPDSG
jgi:MoaA/NifB/PqqE/SkfB family radical SAM enzyme